MSVLARTMTLALLALWGLATWHCSLEQLPALEFLACCQHPEKAPHQDNDCDKDGCATVESGLYRMEEQALSAPAPVLCLTLLSPLREATTPILISGLESPSWLRPECPRIWQFSLRMALPPRAPSFIS